MSNWVRTFPRRDDVGSFGDATSPRLAVIYRAAPASTLDPADGLFQARDADGREFRLKLEYAF